MTAYPWANLWLAATLALIVGHALVMRARGRLFVFDPLFAFWGGFYICNISQPMDYAPVFVAWHGVGIFDLTLFYSLLGAASVVWGYELKLGPRLGTALPRLPRKLDPGKFFWMGAAVAALGIGDYYFLFQSGGGMWEWLSWPRGGTDYATIGPIVGGMEQLAPLGAYFLLLHVHMHPSSRLKKAAAYALSALLWVWYLYLGTRSRIIGVAMLSAAAIYTPKRRNPSLWVILPAFLALFILTNFQAIYRYHFSNLSFHWDQTDKRQAAALCLPGFLGGSRALKDMTVSKGIDFNVDLTVVDVVPKKFPYSYGWNFMELITHWIPHSLWKDKRYPILESVQGVFSEITTNYQVGTDLLDGPSISFLAFWYNICGPLSLVLGGLFTGVMFRTFRTIADRDPGSEGDLVLYNTFLAIGFLEAASEPLSWIYSYAFIWPPIIYVVYLCRRNPADRMLTRVR